MIFLQPFALAAIPLIAIPLIIHWLNHRRHKPVHWAAMRFLKQAQKHNRGMAKLRYWLLLALRMLAVAAIVFLLSRPLQTGYLASWTGAPATNLIVLDLSPSMQSQSVSGSISAAENAIYQLDEMRRSTGQRGQRILFTQPSNDPLVLPDDITIAESITSSEQAASADIPATVSSALRWAANNVSGPIDLWVCSDLQQNDWQSESSRWQEIREQLKALPAVRLNVLAQGASTPSNNLAIAVDRVVRKQVDNRAELVFDLRIQQTSGDATSRSLSLTFEIAGIRSAVEVELTGREKVLAGLAVPIDPQLESGFGVVALPADSNPADNQYRFVFAKPTPVQAAVVAEDAAVGQVLQLALERPGSENSEVKVSVISPAQASQIDWANTALVAWQAELPSGNLAVKLSQVLDRGGCVVFLPPSQQSLGSEAASSSVPSFLKARWGQWQQTPDGSQPWQIVDWRSDSDLLGNTAAGQPLSVHEWQVRQFCNLTAADAIPLAKISDKELLLARVATERGGLYFLTTLPTDEHSNLVTEAVSLYVMMQRALEVGLSNTGNARCLIAGQEMPSDLSSWKRLDESGQTILDNQRGLCSAVYQQDTKLIAINRPTAEDNTETVSEATLQQLLEQVNFRIIEKSGYNNDPLASEIWRWFAVALVVCLLVEAWMTMPNVSASEARS